MGASDIRATVAMASDFVNEINGFRPGLGEGRMKVILGLRYRGR